jgi:hypothetical protein
MSHLHPTWRERARTAERRVAELEAQAIRYPELVNAAMELDEANEEADKLLHDLFSSHCGERMEVRHEILDRLTRAERTMRRVAREMVNCP